MQKIIDSNKNFAHNQDDNSAHNRDDLVSPIVVASPLTVDNLTETYSELLTSYCQTQDESLLIELNEFGKFLVQKQIPPEDIANFQHYALESFDPAMLPAVLPHITPPLAEVLMAYGLSFRTSLEQRYAALLHERLAQSERLEALGTLAAGIAHDFNTILGVIMGFTEMTLDSAEINTFDRANLEQILIATQRARDLVIRILTFARKEQTRYEPVALDAILRESCALLQPTLPPGIKISVHQLLENPVVLAAPSDLRQIIINLAVNAADAMEGSGLLDFTVTRCTHPPPELPLEKEYLELRVRDTGTGIPPEILPRIFDPFFTTKMPGKGSGLGLAMIHGIVQRLGGAVRVTSILKTGTTFEIVLPCWKENSLS